MQDGSRARITLLSYHKVNGVVFYDFEIHIESHIFKWSERYSKLKDICSDFPATLIKFPPKDSIRSLINNLALSEGFLPERFALLKSYFQSVSISNQLHFNPAFLKICRNLQKINDIKAPVIKGKKLNSIQVTQKDNYILV